MNVRPALLAAAALAATLAALTLCRWGNGGNRDPVSFAWEVQRGDDLGAHHAAGRRRDEAKRVLAAEVVAGRMTVREAADHFRRLDDTDPSYPPGVPRPPGYDRVLRESVLDWVWLVLGHQQRYAAAARWYAAAFAADPQLLAGPRTTHRYLAACAAAMAGCGQGRDAGDLDEGSRAAFRRQGLDWLRAELAARRRLLDKEPAQARWVADNLQHWLWDAHFAGVRGPDALARMPEAERQAWQELWAEAADTRARAEGTAPAEQRAGGQIPLPER
jgi:hypothetical protein